MNFLEKLKKFLGNRKLEDLTDAEKAELEATLAITETDAETTTEPDKSETDGGKDDGEQKRIDNDDKAGAEGLDSKSDAALESKTSLDKKEIDEGDNNGLSDVGTKSTVILIDDGYLNDDLSINADKVHNENVLKILNELVSKIRLLTIEKSLNESVKEYNLAVSVETIKKLIDMSKITIKKDSVIGIKEALEALKVSEPTIFKAITSNPINEPFNPIKKELATNGMITSEEAWASKEGVR